MVECFTGTKVCHRDRARIRCHVVSDCVVDTLGEFYEYVSDFGCCRYESEAFVSTLRESTLSSDTRGVLPSDTWSVSSSTPSMQLCRRCEVGSVVGYVIASIVGRQAVRRRGRKWLCHRYVG